MPPTTRSSFSRRLRILKGFVAFVLCVSFVLPQIFAPQASKASAGPAAPKSAPPEAFLINSSSSVSVGLAAYLTGFTTTIKDVINGPAIPEGLEMAKVPSLSERLGSIVASAVTVEAAAASAAPPPPPGTVSFDFDGDGKADIARWRSANSEFKIQNSNGGTYSTYTIGSSGSKPAPADYDGDGITDAAVFNSGTWTIRQSSNSQTVTISGFGQSGDIPVSGNYTGGASADAAVYRPSNGTWYIRDTGTGNVTSTQFGAAGDIAVPGNYDGDSVMDPAVFRPSTGDWHILGSQTGYSVFHWGVASDIPVPADFDGDGKTDFAVYRGSTGTWYAHKSGNAEQYFQETWGNYGDQPVPADYDGDGKADFAVWRPTNGVWYTKDSYDGEFHYQTLGSPGDMAVPSSYLKQIGGQVSGYSLAKARLSPRNATGGTNLYSQNFSLGTSLVGLPGRAGLDAGFGISYNSLIWTKDGSSIYFDTNQDNVSPGFRLGFSTIEPAYYDTVTQTWNYLMVTPSGGRVEFRQTAASDTYETADSSYLQLKTQGASNPNDPVEDITITVRGTDGTAMVYVWNAGAFRCSEIKDRNGNYITVTHDDQGSLTKVTDTLGREITVQYDAELYPTSIKQTWKSGNGDGSDVVHTWATLVYENTPINTNFGSLTVVGPGNGSQWKVLKKVIYGDAVNNTGDTRFTYNSYGQVTKIANHAADGHELNYTSTNLDSVSGVQNDCPRFTLTRSMVENFNGGVPIQVTNTLTAGQPYDTPAGSGTGTRIEVSMANHPHGAISKTYVGSSGWMEGVPIVTEDWANGTSGIERKRWTWTNYTQDDENVAYITNPRVLESKVGDTTNIKRTSIEYRIYFGTTIAEYGLVSAVNVHDSDQNTILKRSETDYDLSAAYVDRRIIGLPTETRAYGRETSGLNLMSKMTYAYDQGNFSDAGLGQNISPVQHDYEKYGASFIIGRGNLTSSTRHDVLGQSAAVTSTIKYNTAGAPVAQIDPMNRMVKIGYADNFNSTVSNPTYAYPTNVTDPANNTSTVLYRYDIGLNVRAQSPAPAGNTQGKITERYFDSIGRLQKDLIVNSGAYTRYEYPSNGIQSKVYSTIIDTNNNNTGDAADEVLSESWLDGAGRVLRSRTEHPGSIGGWSATIAEYDILGRVARQSVPTEVSVPNPSDPQSWDEAGDDALRGFLWAYQKYDWMGRVVRKINTDGDPQLVENDSDVLISYDGCGCAGGLVTTIKGEKIIETDWQGNNPVTLGRRTQKIYQDILGRSFKTEVYDWNGANLYSTTVNTYNGRDQVTNTQQSGDYATRNVTMSYDGFGRMKTRHYPIEDTGANTVWTYNADDSINTVTDPRGVITNFTYYPITGLLNQITYDVPGGQTANIPDTPDVTFVYDNLGNRTSMTDGTGSTAYTYNELSQLTNEAKTITGVTGSFPINYTYTLSGSVRTISDPLDVNQLATYSFDKAGRATGVVRTSQGTSIGSIYQTTFRAWGGLKEFRRSGPQPATNLTDKFNYDSKLQVSQYLRGTDELGYATINYQRYADGKVKYSQPNNPTFDRRFRYDFLGRIIQGQSGFEANGRTDVFVETPYRNQFSYNAFSETANISGKHWEATVPAFAPVINESTGRTDTSFYDSAGNTTSERVTSIPSVINRTMKYDAAGRTVEIYDPRVRACCENNHTYSSVYDGDGARVKQVDLSASPNGGSNTEFKYEIRSTVLRGEVVGELKTFDWSPGTDQRFITPINGVKFGARVESTAPEDVRSYGEDGAELDTRGADVGEENPYTSGGNGGTGYPNSGGDPTNFQRCSVDGSVIECSKLYRIFIKTPQFFNLLAIHKSRVTGQLPRYDYTSSSDPNGTEITGGWGGTSTDGRTIVNLDISIPDETMEQVFRGYASVTMYSRQTISSVGQTRTPEPLNEKERAKLDKAMGKINKMLTKTKCQDFLKKTFGEDILSKISATLLSHQAFSGPRSTNLTTVEAGILSQSEAARLRQLAAGDDPVAASAANYELNRSVAQYFADSDGRRDGRRVGAAIGNYNGNPNTAFYRSFKASFVFHENLHTTTGMGDIELATKLGIDPKSFSGDSKLASSKINPFLKKHGCK